MLIVQLTVLSGGAKAQGLFDGLFQSPAPKAEAPVADPAPEAQPADKPQTTKAPRARRTTVLKNVPLPPVRPAWLDQDEPATTATVIPKTESDADPAKPPVQAAAPAPDTQAERNAEVPQQAPVERAPPVRSQQRTITLIVRAAVRSPADLEGSRIALVQDDQRPDKVTALVQVQTGVHLEAVSSSWSAALNGLARGDLAGVLVSIGPALSASETAGLNLSGYRLMELPVIH